MFSLLLYKSKYLISVVVLLALQQCHCNCYYPSESHNLASLTDMPGENDSVELGNKEEVFNPLRLLKGTGAIIIYNNS